VVFAPASRLAQGLGAVGAGVHVRDVLDAVATRHPGLLERFGGHAMAPA
jgi:single-stranded-DNA-specific exonuclease